MKAKELASLLMQNPEFEVEICICDTSNCTVENPWPDYKKRVITGIADVGYSSKIIMLDCE